MSTNDSVSPSPPALSSDAITTAPPALPWRFLERITAYKEPLELGLTLVLFGIALLVCWHLVSEIDLPSLHSALLGIPAYSIAGALAATVLGFIILLGYEWSAQRFAGVKIPTRILMLGGFYSLCDW
ncbi:phosphatidylglycerol lysyltransferase [Pseudomonas duriflava]|uniref:Phosphatidylglycerol lysyltransferase n=1 Tax=Pseudomonas duriflava TaxID=459528 RepID=A0A562QFQ5_9PSED|nr:phosphatidylglycerol lysyltransferase [Pseudomonas duriflava]